MNEEQRRRWENLEPCERCGYVHQVRNNPERPSCTAHVRRDGEQRPCGNYPMHGGNVCRFHGGAAAQVRARAAEREAQAAVDRILKLQLAEVDQRHLDSTPDEKLLMEVGRTAQAVEWLATRVAELKVPDPEDNGPLAGLEGIDEDGNPIVMPNAFHLYGPDHLGDLAPHVLWQMLNQERDRLARQCKLAIDSGISERLVRLAESQAMAFVSVILAVLDALPNLTAQDRDLAKRVAAQKLRELGPVVQIEPPDLPQRKSG